MKKSVKTVKDFDLASQVKCEASQKEGESAGRCREHPKYGLTVFVTDVFRISRKVVSGSFQRRENYKILELQVDSRVRCGACVGSAAPVLGVCWVDPQVAPQDKNDNV